MKTANDIAGTLTAPLMANNAAIGETNRRMVRIGDGFGNARPAAPLTPRDVYYRSSLDQNDRGVALLDQSCPIPIASIDGFYDVEVWACNIPGSSQVVIRSIADMGGLATGGATPSEQATNAAAFPTPDRLVLFRLRPADGGGRAIYVDVGPYALAYQIPAGGYGFASSQELDISDPTDAAIYVPTDIALAATYHRILGIALDPTSGSYIVIPGTPAVASGTLPQRDDFVSTDYEALDFTGYYPCGYLYDYYGQTDVEEDDCLRVFDPRLFVQPLHPGVIARTGTTGDRPLSPVTGQMYFDSSLGIPIWFDGAHWVNATGGTV